MSHPLPFVRRLDLKDLLRLLLLELKLIYHDNGVGRGNDGPSELIIHAIARPHANISLSLTLLVLAGLSLDVCPTALRLIRPRTPAEEKR